MKEFKNIYLRPHNVKVYAKCPSSVEVDPDMKINDDMDTAPRDLGLACHDMMLKEFPDGRPDEDTVKQYAGEYEVEYEGFMGLKHKASKAYKSYEKLFEIGYFSNPIQEEKMQGELANGYKYGYIMDMYESFDNWVTIADLKTGMVLYDWENDLKFYGLSINKIEKKKRVNGIVFAPQMEFNQAWRWDDHALEEFELFLIKRMEFVGKQYNINPLCKTCPRLATCPAIKTNISRFEGEVEDALKDGANLEFIAKNRHKVQVLKKLTKWYDDAEKALLEKFGQIDMGDGYMLVNNPERRTSYNVGKCLKIIKDEFGILPTSILKQTKIDKKEIKAAIDSIMTESPPKERSRILVDILERIESIDGAVNITNFHKRALKPIGAIEK